MDADVYLNGNVCQRREFSSEEEFEEFVEDNSKELFGESSVFLEMKKQINSRTLGGTVPDGFLFDLSDVDNPQFYLVEVELQKHGFYSHIFPQITKFFSSINRPENENKIVEQIYSYLKENPEKKRRFKELIGDKEIYKTIKDAVVNSEDILVILDEKKEEITEVNEIYTDTWDKMVKTMVVSVFNQNNDRLITVEPKFEKLGLVDITGEEKKEGYDEEYHLEGKEESTKEIYNTLKEKVLSYNNNLEFNPQKYYISIRDKKNFAYIKLRKTKIQIVVMLPIHLGEEIIQNYKVKESSQSVKDYYNGECFRVTVDNKENLNEVLNALKKAHNHSIN